MFFSVSHTTHHTTTHQNNTTTTPHGDRHRERQRQRQRQRQREREKKKTEKEDRDKERRGDGREEDKTTEERREKIRFQCGGAWPFFFDGVLFLVNPVCARDFSLLNSVKYDCSLIFFQCIFAGQHFLFSASCAIHTGTVFQFFELFTYAVTVSKNGVRTLLCNQDSVGSFQLHWPPTRCNLQAGIGDNEGTRATV